MRDILILISEIFIILRIHLESNLMKKSFITKLNKFISLYRAIPYFAEGEEEGGIDIVNPRNKISFFINKKTNKEEIQLQLTKRGKVKHELQVGSYKFRSMSY